MAAENNTSINAADNGATNHAAPLKTSRWIGIVAFILFFVFGGQLMQLK